ncbi:ABC transporter permease [Muricoccus radiodurans]|uniref:ABC transporter permease n=1 Tax=Muricoccus radiodurans TaxID=2231721 RepID=UPI003CFAE2A8
MVREDRAAEAKRRLQEGLARAPAPPGFGVFAAAILLGLRDMPFVDEDVPSLAVLLQEGSYAGLPRLAGAVLRMARDPADEMARMDAASLLLDAGEPHWAEQAMLPGWHRDASALFCRVMSGVWNVLGRQALALESARAAVRREPGLADYHVHHAGLLLQGQEPGSALLAAGRAIGLRPDEPVAWRQASAAFLAMGHTAEAIEASRQAAALSADQQGFAEEVLVSAGAEALRSEAGWGEADSPGDDAPSPARQWPAWARPPAVLAEPRRDGLARFAAARLRVLDALMLREARTFFTHSKLGYTWALFEPLTHVFVLMIAISFLGGDHPPVIGDSLPVFYMTGVLPYLFLCHLTEKGMDLARSQRVVLTLPTVNLADVIAASLLLRAATDAVVLIVSVGVFIAIGMAELPRDALSLVLAYLLLFLLGSGIAAVNMALSTLSSVPEKIWPIALRAFYFLSGIFYHPDAMPTEFREIVLWNPLLHVIEWVRQAYFPLYVSPYLDTGYVFRCAVAALLLGTLAAAAASRRARLVH